LHWKEIRLPVAQGVNAQFSRRAFNADNRSAGLTEVFDVITIPWRIGETSMRGGTICYEAAKDL
jgi:hypothetical protein